MSECNADAGALDELPLARAVSVWAEGLRPPPALTVDQWADQHRRLGTRSSAEPGPYRTARTPYLREIMRQLSASSPARRVVLMKGAQIGASEAGLCWIGWIIHHAPGPIMAVMPTTEMAKRFSRQRVASLIADTPALHGRVAPPKSRDSSNTIAMKEFRGGTLIITGANSAVGLRSMPARYLMLDEIDAYPASADDEGDPVALAEARSRTFGTRAKMFLLSTPTIKGVSRIEQEYLRSDRRRYYVPCPKCGAYQTIDFDRLRWNEGEEDKVALECCHCNQLIDERYKTDMLPAGEWRATAVSEDPATVGYQISSLYSPLGWLSWSQIVRQWLAAKTDEQKRAATNTILGETWQERGDAPDWEGLAERREAWPEDALPRGICVLTAGVDVQRDRLECDVWGWGPGLESWLVDHVVCEGGPASPQAWEKLEDVLGRTWRREDGAELVIARAGLDTGYETAAVYEWLRRNRAIASPLKGGAGWGRGTGPIEGPTTVRYRTASGREVARPLRLWTVRTAVYKQEFYRQLRAEEPAQGRVHLPAWVTAEWLQQLTAERLVIVKDRAGYLRREWRLERERNEALDCRIYARAALAIEGADRWTEEQWRARARGAVKKEPRQTSAPSPQPDAPSIGVQPQELPQRALRPPPPRNKFRAYGPAW